MSASQDRPTASGDDAAEQIERAAIELLREQGVLAGINLREVADRAGVARALVYYHFGSREELLRAAINRLNRLAFARFRFRSAPTPIGQRARGNLESLISFEQTVRLRTLLELDGHPAKPFFLNRDHQLATLKSDQAAGHLDADIEPKLVLAAIVALSLGYVLHRSTLSEELWIPVDELDRRMSELVERLFSALAPRPQQ